MRKGVMKVKGETRKKIGGIIGGVLEGVGRGVWNLSVSVWMSACHARALGCEFVRQMRGVRTAFDPASPSLWRGAFARLGLSLALVLQSLLPAAFWAAGGLLVSAAPAGADIAQRINFQGRLTDSANNPRTGTFTFKFRIYDAPTGGNPLWPTSATEDQAITVTNGVFSVQLGAVTPIPVSLFGNPDVYLEVQVFDGSTTETLSPRQKLVSAPYAFNAEMLSGRTTDYFVSTGPVSQTIAGTKTFTNLMIVGGNLGVGTNAPLAQLHAFAPAGTAGSQLIVSTGTTRLLEVNGSSVALGAPLYFPDGSAQYTAAPAGSVSLSSTQTWTGQNSYANLVQVSSDVVLSPPGRLWIGSKAIQQPTFPLAPLHISVNGAATGPLVIVSTTGFGSSTAVPRIFEVNQSSIALGAPLFFPDGTSMATAAGGASQWTTSGSDIYNVNAGNVGVGTTGPSSKLDISGGSVTIRDAGAGLAVGTSQFIVVPGSGLTGIGTDTPQARLHTFSEAGNTGVGVELLVSTGTVGSMTRLFEVTGSSITLGLPLFFPDQTSMTTAASQWATSGLDIFNNNSGNVGIGSSAPSNILDIKSDATDPTLGLFRNTAATGAGAQVTFDSLDQAATGRIAYAVVRGEVEDITGPELGTLIFKTRGGAGVVERMRISSSGKVGIGTSAPVAALQVSSAAGTDGPLVEVSTGTFNVFEVNGSSVVSAVDAFKPGGGSWSTLSDIRLKKNIHTLDGALEKMLRLRGVNFEWKEPGKDGRLPGVQTGVIAQEVEKVFPEWVGTTPQGTKYVTFRGFEALTIEAVRELKAEEEDSIRKLSDENAELRRKNEEFERRIRALEIRE